MVGRSILSDQQISTIQWHLGRGLSDGSAPRIRTTIFPEVLNNTSFITRDLAIHHIIYSSWIIIDYYHAFVIVCYNLSHMFWSWYRYHQFTIIVCYYVLPENLSTRLKTLVSYAGMLPDYIGCIGPRRGKVKNMRPLNPLCILSPEAICGPMWQCGRWPETLRMRLNLPRKIGCQNYHYKIADTNTLT